MRYRELSHQPKKKGGNTHTIEFFVRDKWHKLNSYIDDREAKVNGEHLVRINEKWKHGFLSDYRKQVCKDSMI